MGWILTIRHNNPLCTFVNTSIIRVVCRVVPLVNLALRDMKKPRYHPLPWQLTSLPKEEQCCMFHLEAITALEHCQAHIDNQEDGSSGEPSSNGYKEHFRMISL